MYKDVVVGQYYNVHMRGGNAHENDLGACGFTYDPSLFRDDTGERD